LTSHPAIVYAKLSKYFILDKSFVPNVRLAVEVFFEHLICWFTVVVQALKVLR
jgi:hypothetical protein